MHHISNKKYKTILADPPWTFLTRSDKGKDRSAEQHYSCMSFDDILKLPVGEIADKDCMLFLWTTDPMLEKSFEVIKAWGFEYKTVGFVWVKRCRKSEEWFMGMGYYTRANPEYCLLATKGHPKRNSRSVRKLIDSPLREHSRKPDDVYKRITTLTDGPFIELFSRTDTKGWDNWGNETGTWKNG